ncbi:MAG: hypothetical protein HN919_16110 [Verrucomicrobia bacterium]|jgi:hypothetical protein|nr:hypothetical protein [Verrucomicrobiota bacterium]MBT7067824.1 hypothetical protein [Verrucomicrobiota bacterium]MBT7701968.1 hypothetical protein [Verrucomicrobiota bacterium]
MNRQISQTTGILIVNGGRDPQQGRWLPLCINNIIRHTVAGSYHLYVWNNSTRDHTVKALLAPLDTVTLTQCPANAELAHCHATPLHTLYEMARADGIQSIVVMDSDAHPVHHDWLPRLTAALDDGAALAGVWRDELAPAIAPYLHASCLAARADFIEGYNLRLDVIPGMKDGQRSDTLSLFTRTAQEHGETIFKLRRSNQRNYHPLLGGIYGDLVYHHGAGSRPRVAFWGQTISKEVLRRNRAVIDMATRLLFTQHDDYMAWLRGKEVSRETQDAMAVLVGMAEESLDDGTSQPRHPSPPGRGFPQRLRAMLGRIAAAGRPGKP